MLEPVARPAQPLVQIPLPLFILGRGQVLTARIERGDDRKGLAQTCRIQSRERVIGRNLAQIYLHRRGGREIQNGLRVPWPIGIVLVGRSFHGNHSNKVHTRVSAGKRELESGTLLDLFPRVNSNQIWPDLLYVVRHGESAGNIARDAAVEAGHHMIDIDIRDVDVPLSDLGERQAIALGRWLGALPPEARPNVVLTSPYLRARHTAGLLVKTAGMHQDTYSLIVDERFREKEFGILDRLTAVGIREQFPDQAEFRRILGKFYHRPPGGESWCDVILRLRSATEMLSREYCGQRVLIVCHAVVVLCMRYIIEHLTETELLAIDKKEEVANCSVTLYKHDATLGPRGNLRLELFNFVAPLEEGGAPVTSEPDTSVGAR